MAFHLYFVVLRELVRAVNKTATAVASCPCISDYVFSEANFHFRGTRLF